jgi:hypothetical protein
VTIDIDYYIVHQMPRPDPSQNYDNWGGKVVPTKFGGLPDMWLCYGAFEGHGCKEQGNCVYRHGWFDTEEEAALLEYCPDWLEKARKAWSLNKLRKEFVHQTKVWPFAHPPCHYDDKFMSMQRKSYKPEPTPDEKPKPDEKPESKSEPDPKPNEWGGILCGSELGDEDSSAATKSSHAGLDALLKRLG